MWGDLGVALAEGTGALGLLLGTRRPGVHGVVQQGPAQLYEVGPRRRDLAVHQDDPDDRDHDADEVDAHTDGQNRLPGSRRPQEGDEAGDDDSKARANHPESPDGKSPV
jgi:hypothetical protein